MTPRILKPNGNPFPGISTLSSRAPSQPSCTPMSLRRSAGGGAMPDGRRMLSERSAKGVTVVNLYDRSDRHMAQLSYCPSDYSREVVQLLHIEGTTACPWRSVEELLHTPTHRSPLVPARVRSSLFAPPRSLAFAPPHSALRPPLSPPPHYFPHPHLSRRVVPKQKGRDHARRATLRGHVAATPSVRPGVERGAEGAEVLRAPGVRGAWATSSR